MQGSQAPRGRSWATSQPLFAQEVLNSYPIHQHRCLLDVGGGEGVFLAAAATRAPALRLMLFDLPAVAERARARLADAGLPVCGTSLPTMFAPCTVNQRTPNGSTTEAASCGILAHDGLSDAIEIGAGQLHQHALFFWLRCAGKA